MLLSSQLFPMGLKSGGPCALEGCPESCCLFGWQRDQKAVSHCLTAILSRAQHEHGFVVISPAG